MSGTRRSASWGAQAQLVRAGAAESLQALSCLWHSSTCAMQSTSFMPLPSPPTFALITSLASWAKTISWPHLNLTRFAPWTLVGGNTAGCRSLVWGDWQKSYFWAAEGFLFEVSAAGNKECADGLPLDEWGITYMAWWLLCPMNEPFFQRLFLPWASLSHLTGCYCRFIHSANSFL